MRHFLSLNDVSVAEIHDIMRLTHVLKADFKNGIRQPVLAGKTISLLFEKPSLRTRVSFECGMAQLGGSSLFLSDDVGFGKRESLADFAHVLSSMTDVVAFRAKRHESVAAFAKYSSCPVINALTDREHPCQALADLLTVQERFGRLQGLKIAWVGDCNNVTTSLIQACAKFGVQLTVSSPKEYLFSMEVVREIIGESQTSGFNISLCSDPFSAVRGANAVYTDVWVSMGQESEETRRREEFSAFQVNPALMAAARADAIFLHCMPAKRGQEVTDAVMDGAQSAIIQQAENRMHAQKGLLVWLLGGAGICDASAK